MSIQGSSYGDLFQQLDEDPVLRPALMAELVTMRGVPNEAEVSQLTSLAPSLHVQFARLCTDLAADYGEAALQELWWIVQARPCQAGFEVTQGENCFVSPDRLRPSGTWTPLPPHLALSGGEGLHEPASTWGKSQYQAAVQAVFLAAVAEIEETGPPLGTADRALLAREAGDGVPKDGLGWSDAAFTALREDLVCGHDARYLSEPDTHAEVTDAIESLKKTLSTRIAFLKSNLHTIGKH
ncbi:hypothetical protein ACFYM0_33270 [Streptomyces sp. NPDC006487]|uniref:hypothetical protein n=1 Tax=Streptomyces sp. NPDC006487 TaxID=3364748 RepID=UPI00367ED6D4